MRLTVHLLVPRHRLPGNMSTSNFSPPMGGDHFRPEQWSQPTPFPASGAALPSSEVHDAHANLPHLPPFFLSFPAAWGGRLARLNRKKEEAGKDDESRTESEKGNMKKSRRTCVPGMTSQLGSKFTHGFCTPPIYHAFTCSTHFFSTYTSRHNTR